MKNWPSARLAMLALLARVQSESILCVHWGLT